MAIAGAVGAVLVVTNDSSEAAEVDSGVLARGGEVYATQCAACHGPRGEGGLGEGIGAGPAIAGTPVALNDQMVRTGRMPITSTLHGVVTSEPLAEDDRVALLAWMTTHLDLTGDVIEVGEGSIARGADLYGIHCAACHGSTGTGGVAGAGTMVPGVTGLDPVAVASAVRVGPLEMPSFDDDVLDDEDLDDVTAFVVDGLASPRLTPLGLVEINRVQASVLVGVLALAVLGSLAFIARPPTVPDPPHASRDDDA